MSVKRKHIIETAACLMHRKGYQATSLGDVLRASGVAKGNFYYYFRSKEELGFAVLGRFEEVLRARFDAIASRREVAPLARIEAILDSTMESAVLPACGEECRAGSLHGGCPLGNLAMELSDVHEGFRERLEAIFRHMQSVIEGLLLEHSAGGQGDGRRERLASFVLAGLEGGILLAKVRKAPGVLEETVQEIKSHLQAVMGDGGGGGNADRARA